MIQTLSYSDQFIIILDNATNYSMTAAKSDELLKSEHKSLIYLLKVQTVFPESYLGKHVL